MVYWIDKKSYDFEVEFQEVMKELFWDDFLYGKSMSKVEGGKIRRVIPFSDEWNKLEEVKK